MSKPLFEPTSVFCGIIYHPSLSIETCYSELEQVFDLSIDFKTPIWDFDHTSYYENEMGTGLKRQFLSFKQTIDPSEGFTLKKQSIAIEESYKLNKLRQINIDPGIISHHHVILMSTKNFTHRIALKDGIYADLTLIYTKKHFEKLPWTYPEYTTDRVIQFLMDSRIKHLQK